jgi:hypothetical protein
MEAWLNNGLVISNDQVKTIVKGQITNKGSLVFQNGAIISAQSISNQNKMKIQKEVRITVG